MKQQNNKLTLEELLREFDKDYRGAICDGTGSFNQDLHEDIMLFIKKVYGAGRDSDIRAYCEMCHVFINVHTGERTK